MALVWVWIATGTQKSFLGPRKGFHGVLNSDKVVRKKSWGYQEEPEFQGVHSESPELHKGSRWDCGHPLFMHLDRISSEHKLINDGFSFQSSLLFPPYIDTAGVGSHTPPPHWGDAVGAKIVLNFKPQKNTILRRTFTPFYRPHFFNFFPLQFYYSFLPAATPRP